MAEQVSYWICKCSKANLQQTRVCVGCGKKRRPWKPIVFGGAVIALLGIAALAPDAPTEIAGTVQPSQQEQFLARLKALSGEVTAASNAVASRDRLSARDQELAKAPDVKDWAGAIRGIQPLQGKAGVSIDIGGASVIAGVHLSQGLDTLIAPTQGELYQSISGLSVGDRVTFSGEFAIASGRLVEMSYTGSGSLQDPEFLFQFEKIRKD